MSRKSKERVAYDALKHMNLTRDNNDPEKEPYVTNRELAEKLGMGQATISRARHALLNRGDKIGFDLVYAWRWSGDEKHAKIGVTTIIGLDTRLAGTFHPTDDTKLLGVMECRDREEAKKNERDILNRLQRTRPDREWVIIDAAFNEMITKAFIMPPNFLL